MTLLHMKHHGWGTAPLCSTHGVGDAALSYSHGVGT